MDARTKSTVQVYRVRSCLDGGFSVYKQVARSEVVQEATVITSCNHTSLYFT